MGHMHMPQKVQKVYILHLHYLQQSLWNHLEETKEVEKMENKGARLMSAN